MPANATVKIGLIDDHTLFRKGLANLIEMVGHQYHVVLEADNGLDLQKKISKENIPDLVLLDINMPGMDGFECVRWLSDKYPLIKILVVSMIETEEAIVRMLRMGVKGYLCKDIEPKELSEALQAVLNKGYYFTDFITGKLLHSLQQENVTSPSFNLVQMNDREKNFIQLACSDLTYNEIAARMYLSPKTIDGYRDSLFEKFNVKSRVGLALYAVKHGIVQL
jgi:two-component system invasion response regulator UvrY